MRSCAGLRPLTCLVAALACAKHPEVARRPVPASGPCPPGVVWLAGIPDPPRLHVVNQRGEPVTLFIDECRAHRRIGDVPAGSARVFTLPRDLAVHPAGLRFHPYRAVDAEATRELPVVHVRLDTARVLRLVVPAAEPSRCPPVVYVDGERYSGSLRQIPADKIASIEYHFPDGSDSGREAGCPEIHVRTHEQEE